MLSINNTSKVFLIALSACVYIFSILYKCYLLAGFHAKEKFYIYMFHLEIGHDVVKYK